jgi:hypothetical protein
MLITIKMCFWIREKGFKDNIHKLSTLMLWITCGYLFCEYLLSLYIVDHNLLPKVCTIFDEFLVKWVYLIHIVTSFIVKN